LKVYFTMRYLILIICGTLTQDTVQNWDCVDDQDKEFCMLIVNRNLCSERSGCTKSCDTCKKKNLLVNRPSLQALKQNISNRYDYLTKADTESHISEPEIPEGLLMSIVKQFQQYYEVQRASIAITDIAGFDYAANIKNDNQYSLNVNNSKPPTANKRALAKSQPLLARRRGLVVPAESPNIGAGGANKWLHNHAEVNKDYHSAQGDYTYRSNDVRITTTENAFQNSQASVWKSSEILEIELDIMENSPRVRFDSLTNSLAFRVLNFLSFPSDTRYQIN